MADNFRLAFLKESSSVVYARLLPRTTIVRLVKPFVFCFFNRGSVPVSNDHQVTHVAQTRFAYSRKTQVSLVFRVRFTFRRFLLLLHPRTTVVRLVRPCPRFLQYRLVLYVRVSQPFTARTRLRLLCSLIVSAVGILSLAQFYGRLNPRATALVCVFCLLAQRRSGASLWSPPRGGSN